MIERSLWCRAPGVILLGREQVKIGILPTAQREGRPTEFTLLFNAH